MTWKSKKLDIPKPKSGKAIQPEDLITGSEDGEQAALFCWAALNTNKYPQLENLFAIPNGGNRHIVEAIKFVGTGTRAGVPDTFLPCCKILDTRVSHGLFIEMKIEKYRNYKNGGCSEDQIKWHKKLRDAGYCVNVCYSWIEGRDCLINYLEGRL